MRTLEYVAPQLATIVPMLLVYLVGGVVSLVQLRRLGLPAALALMGCGLLFLITCTFPFVQAYIMVTREDRKWPIAETGRWMSIVGILRMLLQVTASSLLLSAVFAGRRAPAAWGKPPTSGPGRRDFD